mgnify:CR=1 FL=1
MAKTRCPNCTGYSIALFRLDSDWGTAGDFTQVNPDEDYNKYHLEVFNSGSRLDMEAYMCMECYEVFN